MKYLVTKEESHRLYERSAARKPWKLVLSQKIRLINFPTLKIIKS